MALLRSCAAEHDIVGADPADGNREAIGGEFRNETWDTKLDHFRRTTGAATHHALPPIALKSTSLEGRVSAFKILDI